MVKTAWTKTFCYENQKTETGKLRRRWEDITTDLKESGWIMRGLDSSGSRHELVADSCGLTENILRYTKC
jgi:hypothetical protein